MMPFPDLLRLVKALDGRLPDPTPESDPERLLALHPGLASIDVEDLRIPGPRGDVPARFYKPEAPARAGFVWIHGGAFIAGDLDGAEANWVSLRLAAGGIAVLSLDYRKALGGVHYPVPLDDVAAGWDWAVRNAERFGVPVSSLHLGGASAGANLAAGLAKRVRDTHGAARPASLVLAVPLVHARHPDLSDEDLRTMRAGAPGAIFEPEDIVHMVNNYAGTRSVLADPYAFAANGDLTNQPPMLVLTSEFDSLRPSGEAYAAAVAAAGGVAKLMMVRGAPHAALVNLESASGRFSIEAIADWILNGSQDPDR
ncbi:alpha/beta hydrolase [Microbacterium sp. YJN-G]|uniref:alpha/beta hydrolase n=1 Tax=Microbacterium sp. YJN-G TaxID=2763257 RepID=UPI001877B24D|nr:alpha/beta hydrolase [Microbacterium sp. YJN-G]